jgi:hypothetical protein
MFERRWSGRLVSLAVLCLVAAGCGDDDGGTAPKEAETSSAKPTAQESLDTVTDTHRSLQEQLEAAADDPEVDASPVTVFAAAMKKTGLVDAVATNDDWSLDEPLPCTDSSGLTGIVAAGDSAFFIGVTDGEHISGFAEGEDGDIGTIVAQCQDDDSGPLYRAPGPEDLDESTPTRVAVESFTGGDTAESEMATRLAAISLQTADPDTLSDYGISDTTIEDWSWGDPVPCGEGPERTRIGTPPARAGEDAGDADYLWGYATDSTVMVFVEADGNDVGFMVGSCADGEATEFRTLAVPLADVLAGADERTISG